MDYEVATEYFGGLFFGAVMLVAGFALYEGGRHFRSELLRSNLWAVPATVITAIMLSATVTQEFIPCGAGSSSGIPEKPSLCQKVRKSHLA